MFNNKATSHRMGPNVGIRNMGALDKRVPKNPRYAAVQSKVETGMTVNKLALVTSRQHLRRQDEPYYRLSPLQLHELLMEYEQDRHEGVQDFRGYVDPDHHGPKIVQHDADAAPSYDRPYLILDVRTPEEFRRCHIIQARSFEAKLLNQDCTTPELHRFKNKKGHLVVLYCSKEREACLAATKLVHRGFDNVFVLSTGLGGFSRCAACFVEGETASIFSPSGVNRRLSFESGQQDHSTHDFSGIASGGGSSLSGQSSHGSVHGSVYRGTTISDIRAPSTCYGTAEKKKPRGALGVHLGTSGRGMKQGYSKGNQHSSQCDKNGETVLSAANGHQPGLGIPRERGGHALFRADGKGRRESLARSVLPATTEQSCTLGGENHAASRGGIASVVESVISRATAKRERKVAHQASSRALRTSSQTSVPGTD